MRPACAASKSSVRCGPAPPKAPCSRCFRGGALRWDEGCCGNGCADRFGTARASKHARERSGRSSRTRRSPVASVMSSTASRTWLESDHESRWHEPPPETSWVSGSRSPISWCSWTNSRRDRPSPRCERHSRSSDSILPGSRNASSNVAWKLRPATCVRVVSFATESTRNSMKPARCNGTRTAGLPTIRRASSRRPTQR